MGGCDHTVGVIERASHWDKSSQWLTGCLAQIGISFPFSIVLWLMNPTPRLPVHEIPFSQPKISKSQYPFYPFSTLNIRCDDQRKMQLYVSSPQRFSFPLWIPWVPVQRCLIYNTENHPKDLEDSVPLRRRAQLYSTVAGWDHILVNVGQPILQFYQSSW